MENNEIKETEIKEEPTTVVEGIVEIVARIIGWGIGFTVTTLIIRALF